MKLRDGKVGDDMTKSRMAQGQGYGVHSVSQEAPSALRHTIDGGTEETMVTELHKVKAKLAEVRMFL